MVFWIPILLLIVVLISGYMRQLALYQAKFVKCPECGTEFYCYYTGKRYHSGTCPHCHTKIHVCGKTTAFKNTVTSKFWLNSSQHSTKEK